MMIAACLRGRLSALAIGQLGISLLPRTASACSLVDVKTSIADAVLAAEAWWLASVLVAAAVVIVDIRRRPRSLLVITAPLLAAGHPAWWVQPSYGPDCAFANVEASQFVFAALCAMFCYQLVRAWRSRAAS
ncbi:hypothetical protein [Bradyrhizobium sp. SRS-191]|uniref:hypothetical protein n=1 Tax=Bradyrhizobium sp. SRS-191 TaxID=2962606 RepID=UPI00211E316D|nr:hypothetical protein [Bradyrhizobium sp. SRS-191]